MKALVGAFNQKKALVGAFSVIVQPVVEPMDRFTALLRMASNNLAKGARALLEAGAHPGNKGGAGISPMQCAKQSAAR